jgi:hypothetical protein
MSESAIDLPAWPDVSDKHQQSIVLDLVEDPKVADAYAEGTA